MLSFSRFGALGVAWTVRLRTCAPDVMERGIDGLGGRREAVGQVRL